MSILYIGSDHAGYKLKESVKKILRRGKLQIRRFGAV